MFNHWIKAIAKNYGRKRGWANHIEFLLLYRLGYFHQLLEINWHNVSRLVYVCSGNICRSPYAEAKTRALGFETSSFGLNADNYSACDPTAIKIARQHGVDLKEHRSRNADAFAARHGDLFVGMEPWHGKRLQSIAGKSNGQVTLLGLWSNDIRPHIEDPYGLSADYFDTCFSIIDSAVENILYKIGAVAQGRREL